MPGPNTTPFGIIVDRIRTWLRSEVVGNDSVDAADLRQRAVDHFSRDEAFVRGLLAETHRFVSEAERTGRFPDEERRGAWVGGQPDGLAEARAAARGEAAEGPEAAAERRTRAFAGMLIARLDREIEELRREGYYEDPRSGQIFLGDALREVTDERVAEAQPDPRSPFYHGDRQGG